MRYSKLKTVETRKPVKGDTVYVAGVWSGYDRMDYHTRKELPYGPVRAYFRKLVVQSWGLKRATFTDAETGEFIRCEGATGSVHGAYFLNWSFTVDGLAAYWPEIEAEHRDQLAGSLKIRRNWIEEYRGRARADVHANAVRELAERETYQLTVEVKAYGEWKNANRGI